jgi:hypothetical protein
MLGLEMRQASSVRTELFRGMKFKQWIILLSVSAYHVLVFPILDGSERLLCLLSFIRLS